MEAKAAGLDRQRTYITESAEESQRVAKNIVDGLLNQLNRGSTLNRALVLTLYGELGSGKTMFVQGLAQGLGIKRRIISPTFVIVRSYEVISSKYSSRESASRRTNREVSPRQTRTLHFYHIDLYRIESQQDFEGLGLEEILTDPQNIVAIEWAEKMRDALPKERIDIWFEYVDKEKRRITIKKS